MTVNVTSVNGPPLAVALPFSPTHALPITFAAANFGFSDPNDSPANTLQAVIITSQPATGHLRSAGTAPTGLALPTSINLAHFTAGKPVCRPVANADGAP